MNLIPSLKQFRLMKLRPAFQQPLLSAGQCAGQYFNCIHRHDYFRTLIYGMKMRPMMTRPVFREHADANSEKSRQFRHVCH